ncbi:MAG TPA: hypothetical protein VF599_04440 [Pyrinomonadaceae bacterium]|jgi:hypothetical protein
MSFELPLMPRETFIIFNDTVRARPDLSEKTGAKAFNFRRAENRNLLILRSRQPGSARRGGKLDL